MSDFIFAEHGEDLLIQRLLLWKFNFLLQLVL
jgi:hypothetical protein